MKTPREDWWIDAACFNHPLLSPDAWTDPPGRQASGVDPQVIETCLACPVIGACDELAAASEQWGVWAGKTHWERYGREPRYDRSMVHAERNDKGKPRKGEVA